MANRIIFAAFIIVSILFTFACTKTQPQTITQPPVEQKAPATQEQPQQAPEVATKEAQQPQQMQQQEPQPAAPAPATPADEIKAGTPEEAFASIKAAMFKKDYNAVYQLYSKSTRAELDEIAASFKNAPDDALKEIAATLLTTPEELKTATPQKYLEILFSLSDKIQKDPVAKAEFQKQGSKPLNWRVLEVKETKITGDTAEMTFLPDNYKMNLIKEEGGWRFEMKGPRKQGK